MHKLSAYIKFISTFCSVVLAPLLSHATLIQVNETYYGRVTSAYQGDAYVEGSGVTLRDKIVADIEYLYLDSAEIHGEYFYPAGLVVDFTIGIQIIHSGGPNINGEVLTMDGSMAYPNLSDNSGFIGFSDPDSPSDFNGFPVALDWSTAGGHSWGSIHMLAGMTQPDIKVGQSTPGLIDENTGGFVSLDTNDRNLYCRLNAGGLTPWNFHPPVDMPQSELTKWSNASKFGFTFEATPIPEPATMLLFGAGIIGLVGTRIKRKK